MKTRLGSGLPAIIPPGPGQESVWHYPRPPVTEPCTRHLVVEFAGRVVAETRRSQRVLETGHPPTYYFYREDVDPDVLDCPHQGYAWCPYKGRARVCDLVDGERRSRRAAWTYPDPYAGYTALSGMVAFFPRRVDRCLVDGEVVQPQPGSNYGGWITGDIVGPFKGGPGTRGW